MHNHNVQLILDESRDDIEKVKSIVDSLGITSNASPYLSKYSIIRACGAIETAYKTLIADYCSYRSKAQIKNYIDTHIREASSNPSYDNIIKTLGEFDKNWVNKFKTKAKSNSRITIIRTSLQSLVDARNEFAHGGNPTVSINDVLQYFQDSIELIKILDNVIS